MSEGALNLHTVGMMQPGDPGPPRVVLHGFTGSAAAMRPLLGAGLAGRLIAPDLIGHGDSPAPRPLGAYRVDAQIAQLADVVDGIEVFDLIGYSMGARLALSFAIAWPDRVRRLTLLGGRAGIADPTARAIRIRADHALADRIERDGIEAFAQRWAALPLFASQSDAVRCAQNAIRRQQRPIGLANSLRGFGAGSMPPLHARLSALSMPVCLLTGARDTKFTTLAQQMQSVISRVERHAIDGAGHAVHLEAPRQTAAVINAFLQQPFP